jgi:alpha-1,3-mannosyltransferase
MRIILNVPVQVLAFHEAKRVLDETFENCQNDQCAIVTFVNAHALNIAAKDAAFRELLQQSITLNDGVGIDLASLILFGQRFPENLNGTDFVPRYFATTQNYYRVYFLGANRTVVEKAAATFVKIAPRHKIAGYRDGYFHLCETPKIVTDIRHSKADILLVAMGNPAQEFWLKDNLPATGCRIGFGVGALFDFLSGTVQRAPPWIRALSLEWVFRLSQEPKRLCRRYVLGNPVFLARVTAQRLSRARICSGSDWISAPSSYTHRNDGHQAQRAAVPKLHSKHLAK